MELLGHRYYLPALGRFLTQDPMGHEVGLNLYDYSDNNPLIKVDPGGQLAWMLVGAAAGVGIDFTVQMFRHHGHISEIDGKELIISGVTGALGGGASTLIGTLGLGVTGAAVANAGAGATISRGGQIVSNLWHGQ